MRLRTRVATFVGTLAGGMSRAVGTGEGRVIGGRLCRAIDPCAARRLAAGRLLVLVTGTNGKTTTTALITACLEAAGEVASNRSGANLRDGIVEALMRHPRAPFAVLEVDEGLLAWAVNELSPTIVALLNLTRDQLDRFHEVRKVATRWREGLQGKRVLVVANADDPLVVHAVPEDVACVWVAAGQQWHLDATSCPRCGGAIAFGTCGWRCEQCAFRRPQVAFADADLTVQPPLPGQFNRANALMALVVAQAVGIPTAAIAARWLPITGVRGRFRSYRVGTKTARLLLAKNPAGWLETLEILDPDAAVVTVLNARPEDGLDTSWIWDAPLERLAGRTVVACGERATDMAVRLRYAAVDCTLAPSPIAAVRSLPTRRVDIVANYSAFRNVRDELERG